MRIRTLIVEDEPVARKRMKRLVAGFPALEIVGECKDGREAVVAINKLSPDLMFLDIQIPELDGFGVLEAIPLDRMPATIFVTAYDKFALRAFEIHALDYLLKPVEHERLRIAVERASEQVNRVRGADFNDRILSLLQDLRPAQKYPERIVIKSAGDVSFLRTQEIDWIEPDGNYLRVHVGKESYLIRDTMMALGARLDPSQFVRIQRSAIVNIERIKKLQPLFRGDYVIVLRDGTRLTSSRGYRGQLQQILGKSS
ncbi:MAG: LytR/AlgR family response regulator transcription factor [Pyrinomonadaceae bacterium]